MRQLAVRGWPRQLFARLHRWTGLALIAFLFIAGVTGTWLAFRHELDRAINPHLRVVAPGPVQVPLSEVYARVEQRFPGTKVTTAVLQEDADDALVVYLRSTTGSDLPYDQIYANPYTGEILGQRSTRRLSFSKESIDPFMLRLHYSLLAERPGLLLMGIVAIIWFLTSLLGLVLSWPHAWRRLVAWVPILSVRMKGGAYKVNYDLHRASGVALLPVLIVLAFSSIALNLPEVVRPAVSAFSPLSQSPVRKPHPLSEPVVTPEYAVARAIGTVPGGRVSSIYADYSRGWYSVLLHRPGDVAPYGDHFVFIDLASGDVAALRLGEGASAGERFLAWQFPLHTGLAFGRVGQVVIALTGVAIVALCVTGFYVWWRKWRERQRAYVRTTSQSRRRAAELVAASAASAALLVGALTSYGAAAQAGYPRSMTDGRGHTVTLKVKPVRIASLVLGVDENLLDLVDPSRIVTMTEIAQDTYVSNIADRIPPGKLFIRDKWQTVIDARPDLVLAATYTPTLADSLLARGLPVYQFSEFNSIEALLKNFEILGQLVGEEQKAAQILAADRARLAAAAKRKPARPMRAVYFSEGLLFTTGTVPSQVLSAAGLVDAVAESGRKGIVKATPALIAEFRPDLIVVGEDSKEAEAKTLALFKSAPYQVIPAAKAGRVHAIAGKHMTTTSHHIVKAVEDVQAIAAARGESPGLREHGVRVSAGGTEAAETRAFLRVSDMRASSP